MIPKRPPLAECPERIVLLLRRVSVGDECWPWLGRLDRRGYGRYSFNRITGFAHRAVYELLVGPIPAGLEIDHLCRNPRCVRPSHLEPVTHAENMRRARKDVCPQGHPFTPENTYIPRNGRGQRCRTCNRERVRRITASGYYATPERRAQRADAQRRRLARRTA